MARPAMRSIEPNWTRPRTQKRGGHHDIGVPAHGPVPGGDGIDQSTCADDQEDIGGIGSDDIPESDIGRTSGCGANGHQEFRHGRAEADDDQRDDECRYRELLSQGDRPAQEPLGAKIQSRNSGNDQDVIHVYPLCVWEGFPS